MSTNTSVLSNYQNVRVRQDSSEWRAIPFEGLLLSALIVAEESHEPYVLGITGKALVNFDRYRIIYNNIKDILSFKEYTGLRLW